MRALCRVCQTFIHINIAAATRGKGLIIELAVSGRTYQLADIKILHAGEKLNETPPSPVIQYKYLSFFS
jgi:hypothetical protein